MPLSWERKNEVGWWSICALKYLSPHFTPLPESHHHTHPLGPDPRVRILPSLQDVKGETPHPSCGLRVPQGWGSIYPHRHPALPRLGHLCVSAVGAAGGVGRGTESGLRSLHSKGYAWSPGWKLKILLHEEICHTHTSLWFPCCIKDLTNENGFKIA